MDKTLIHIFLSFSLLTCKTVELTDGTKITKRQEKKIYEKVFNDTFDQMKEEDQKLLFESVNFKVDTLQVSPIIDTTHIFITHEDTQREIKVYTDTSYTITNQLTLYKELIPSTGDTAITYENDLIIVEGVKYFSFEEHIWIDFRISEIYE